MKHLLPRLVHRDFLKFCLVGGSAAVASVCLLYLAVDVAKLPYLPASVGVFLIVNVCAYVGSRHFAFRESTVAMHSGLLRYFSVTGANLVVNSLLLVILVEWFGLDPVLSTAILALVIAPLNFVLHRRLTFGLGRKVAGRRTS